MSVHRSAILLLFVPLLGWAKDFIGELELKLELTSGATVVASRMRPWAHMPFPYEAGEEVYDGTLEIGWTENDRISVSAAERRGGEVRLYIDLNGITIWTPARLSVSGASTTIRFTSRKRW